MSAPDSVARFRAQYRAEEIPTGYSPALHALFTFGGGSLALIACAAQVQEVALLEWLTVPLALVYANLAEYFGHRFPMHHPWRGLGLIYKRHAGQHHRFFTDAVMPIDEPRDVRATLFPPVLVIFFFGGFGVPLWFGLNALAGSNVAWLALATGVFYYLHYEVLHFSYHAPADSWLATNALVRALKPLHTVHHDPARMVQGNFNITWPLGDWLFGTRLPASGRDDAAGDGGRGGSGIV